MLSDEIRYHILRELERDPQLSQRELAEMLGVSVGKTNFCLRALVDKGLVKVENFRRSGNKLAYAYQLTPSGIADKARMTKRYLQIKIREYESLQSEIEELRREVTETTPATKNEQHLND
jgi:EPS-associated MarR family transcriptional regulator